MTCCKTYFTLVCALALGLVLPVVRAAGQVTIYHDRTSFEAALGHVVVDDFEAYPLGDIPLGDRRGEFLYTSDPAVTQPAIAPDGAGGQALGGSPFDVFVGEDSATLTFASLSGANKKLRAVGLDVAYGPSFEDLPGNLYRLGIEDGAAAGQFAGNLPGLDGNGGTFFLGIVGGPGDLFTSLRLYSVQPGREQILIPAYQGDNLTYAAVPEPGVFCIIACGAAFLGGRCRRRMGTSR